MGTTTGILGGTFDTIHDGHRALLITAFDEGDHIIIGITSDKRANEPRERDVTPYSERVINVREECKTYQNVYDSTFELVKISNGQSTAIESEAANFIVLSPEQKTHEQAAEINLKRVQQGKDRLKIIEAPMVKDYEGNKISSTRIANNEIDEHGDEI